MDDDGPDSDIDATDEFPDVELEENELKSNDDIEKAHTKSGESLQSTLWFNPNEREIEDLKKFVHVKLNNPFCILTILASS